MQRIPDFLADYAVLKAPVGCDLEELKRCYRRAIRELHPDLNPELAEQVEARETLQQLTLAHRRLCEFHRVHGRLPGTRRPASDHLTADAPSAVEPAGVPVPATTRRGTLLLALVTFGAVAWMLLRPLPEPAGGAARAPVASGGDEAATVVDRPGSVPGEVERGIRLGDDKRTVRAILGRPIVGSHDLWQYGPSHVRFENGVVVGWYNSPLKPIRVDER